MSDGIEVVKCWACRAPNSIDSVVCFHCASSLQDARDEAIEQLTAENETLRKELATEKYRVLIEYGLKNQARAVNQLTADNERLRAAFDRLYFVAEQSLSGVDIDGRRVLAFTPLLILKQAVEHYKELAESLEETNESQMPRSNFREMGQTIL